MVTLIIVTSISVILAVGCGIVYKFIDWSDAFEGLAYIFGFVAAILLIILGFSAPLYESAKYQAKIINREYGTEYTQDEVFWAKSVIEEVRRLERTRIEIDGDIMREKSKE